MKGLFQASLALAAISATLATPLARGRHMDFHRRNLHHDKRALVVITKTQEIVEIEYIYSTVYVDPATVVAAEVSSTSVEPTSTSISTTSTSTSTSTTSTSTTSTSTSTSTTEPPPPPPPTSTLSSETSTFTTPSLPTEVIPVVVPPPPPTTTSTTPTPTPTPEPTPEPVTTQAPAPIVAPDPVTIPPPVQTSSAGGSSGAGGEMFYGEGTYYDCGLGSCGLTNTNDDYVVAMSKLRMAPLDGGNPNNNPLCGQKVRVYSDMAPEGVVFTVMDKCPGCPGNDDLDICRGPFLKFLGTEAQGRIKLWWHWEK